MALVDLVMPKMGESIMEATILRWHKKTGDFVKQDETIMDIATDKVDSEVPSTAEGILEEMLCNDNDIVPVGTVIARIRVGAVADQSTPKTPIAQTPADQIPENSHSAAVYGNEAETVSESLQDPAEIPYQPAGAHMPRTNGIRFYSPLVLNIAANEGISMVELEKIPGTGAEGRVTKKDILDYVGNGRQLSATSAQTANNTAPAVHVVVPPAAIKPIQPATHTTSVVLPPAEKSTSLAYSGNVEIVEMDRMRRMIADHMVKSKATSPHVTSFSEADVTNMVLWRERVKKDFEKREGEKITFTPLFIEAIVKCLKKYPWLNASVDGDKIIVKKDINIGMATALPSGNLIVPVIKGADNLNLVGLTKNVNNLANAARNGKLKPDDTSGGTFTFTNVGTFGSLMGTPIINQPQVAILATGAIKKKPVVIETEQGDSIAIRHMMFVSMSYDHRVIDGSLGATFVTAVVKELENFDVNRGF
jgi:2-oxoglutarate dehydrogenase E2 component (dihydrolipoamide succinyltransferase)